MEINIGITYNGLLGSNNELGALHFSLVVHTKKPRLKIEAFSFNG
jgi:hypothetical protein